MDAFLRLYGRKVALVEEMNIRDSIGISLKSILSFESWDFETFHYQISGEISF